MSNVINLHSATSLPKVSFSFFTKFIEQYRFGYLFEVFQRVLVHGVHLGHTSNDKVHDGASCSHGSVLLTSYRDLFFGHLSLFQPSTNYTRGDLGENTFSFLHDLIPKTKQSKTKDTH